MDETLRRIILNSDFLRQWSGQLTDVQSELIKGAHEALLAVVQDVSGEEHEDPH